MSTWLISVLQRQNRGITKQTSIRDTAPFDGVRCSETRYHWYTGLTHLFVSRRRDGNDQFIRTKGDNNPVDDVGLYRGPKYLKREDMIGKVQGYVPYVGYVTIMMVSLPQSFLKLS